ncbi:hypothetical protein [Dyadobacter sp. BHUBP1]
MNDFRPEPSETKVEGAAATGNAEAVESRKVSLKPAYESVVSTFR